MPSFRGICRGFRGIGLLGFQRFFLVPAVFYSTHIRMWHSQSLWSTISWVALLNILVFARNEGFQKLNSDSTCTSFTRHARQHLNTDHRLVADIQLKKGFGKMLGAFLSHFRYSFYFLLPGTSILVFILYATFFYFLISISSFEVFSFSAKLHLYIVCHGDNRYKVCRNSERFYSN